MENNEVYNSSQMTQNDNLTRSNCLKDLFCGNNFIIIAIIAVFFICSCLSNKQTEC